jgi:hypothetical protein
MVVQIDSANLKVFEGISRFPSLDKNACTEP